MAQRKNHKHNKLRRLKVVQEYLRRRIALDVETPLWMDIEIKKRVHAQHERRMNELNTINARIKALS